VQSGKTASGGCSAGQGSSEPVAPRIIIIIIIIYDYGTRPTQFNMILPVKLVVAQIMKKF
jgi:hypothetical protein